MKMVVGKLKARRFVQNLVAEVVADLLMLSSGIVIGYHLKTLMF
ncbi:hypothetical protein E6C60_0749 [Paenibacillus algicola]|uniref:Uncharacterized protein n=1 Tax=Paenibacillus algicola TaxID=2565926 RepID=A0A4P8XIY2_9BACL|nr:hypothetical protein [Paenibacillus algicola]QCT01470.1 hypothetical protein E6C60_0749 [Paenibacillus algicola]